MSQDCLKFCLIVPCYEEHAKKLDETLSYVSGEQLDIIVVDDGSSFEYAKMIQETSEKHKALIVKNSSNLGKGGAVKAGILKASDLGYTHAIQLDSDGQHDTTLLSKFKESSERNPEALISGRPIFDESVPKKRLYGRYFTHMWVWLETLSFHIKDTMCGFRSYPVKKTQELIENASLGNHMDFDIEVMVKLYWSGLSVEFIPLKVLYPEEGKSYFHMFRDNYRISMMHFKLVLGMLIRIPRLVARKFSKNKWSEANEKGGLWLMKLASRLYEILGYRFIKGLCYFISFYYYLFASSAKKSSKDYQKIYQNYCKSRNIEPVQFSAFGHILCFAHMVLDKIAILKKDIAEESFYEEEMRQFVSIHEKGKGAFFISSHFGSIEGIRALGKKRVAKIKYNALMYTANSKKIFSVLKHFDPNIEDNIIPVQEVTPELGARLDQKVQQGEWIFCMGDRLTAKSDKSLTQTLLGEEIELPMGPFLLAYLLNAPKVYSIHCYRDGKKFRINLKEITPEIARHRDTRDLYIDSIAKAYLEDLEQKLILHPKQWFNFYKYWK